MLTKLVGYHTKYLGVQTYFRALFSNKDVFKSSLDNNLDLILIFISIFAKDLYSGFLKKDEYHNVHDSFVGQMIDKKFLYKPQEGELNIESMEKQELIEI